MTPQDRRPPRAWAYATLLVAGMLWACAPPSTDRWHLALAHTDSGTVLDGALDNLVGAIRRGCSVRVAWGARRRADPSRTIEHSAIPIWLAVRDGGEVSAQLDDFLINLPVLGEPPEDHPARAPFGGTERAVFWRANLNTSGSFDAVWYDRGTGELITRAPQRHPMRWYADCLPATGDPLFL